MFPMMPSKSWRAMKATLSDRYVWGIFDCGVCLSSRTDSDLLPDLGGSTSMLSGYNAVPPAPDPQLLQMAAAYPGSESFLGVKRLQQAAYIGITCHVPSRNPFINPMMPAGPGLCLHFCFQLCTKSVSIQNSEAIQCHLQCPLPRQVLLSPLQVPSSNPF